MNFRTFLVKLWATVKNPFIRVLAGGTSFYIAYTIITVMADEKKRGVFDPTRFFGYFTILTGCLSVLVMLAVAALPTKWWRSAVLDYALGAMTLYLTITIIVYYTLESPWPNWRLDTWSPVHVAAPIVALLMWFVLHRPNPAHLKMWWPLSWMVYPLVYAVWSIIRGMKDGWYPYGFLNVTANGGTYVLGMVLGLAGGVIVLGYVLLISRFIKHQQVALPEKTA